MSILNNTSARDYDLLYDAYMGSGGFTDGRYLYQHKRESAEDFATRRQQAKYSNFVKVIIDSLVNPIFKKTIIRDVNGGQMLDAFLQDVDGMGTSMNNFMRNAAKWARLYGKVFIVMDNYRREDLAANLFDAVQQRQFPYIYLIRPEQVVDFIMDKYGRFEMFSYKVRSKTTKADFVANAEYETWTWTQEKYTVYDEENLLDEGANTIGVIPVVTLSAIDGEIDMPLPVPPMLHIARANRDLYNRDSEKREILRNQCFPVLVYPMTSVQAAQVRQEGENFELQIGTNNMLNVDATAGNMPKFISPPMEPVTILQSEMKQIVEDMFRQANLTSVLAIETKKSGVAKQWDFENTTNALADAAEHCESCEKDIFRLFSRWTNTEVGDMKVRYPKNFNITDMEDELATAQQMKDLTVGGPVVLREIDRKAAQIYFSDLDDASYDEIMAEIDQMANESYQAEAESDPDVVDVENVENAAEVDTKGEHNPEELHKNTSSDPEETHKSDTKPRKRNKKDSQT